MEIININGDDGIGTKINRYLNRYHAIDEYLKASLKEGYLWFSDPSDFNDPYDCNMSLGTECEFQELYDYLHTSNQRNHWGKTDDYLKARAEFLFANPLEIKKLSDSQDQDTVSTLGVCCFSENRDSLLMWSHYGDKHKGICLTFDIALDNFFGGVLFNVEYPCRYPVYNWPRDEGKFNSLRFLIATKSREWEYEQEIRIVRDDTRPPYRGKIKFNKKSLKSIQFGYKCSYENIALLKGLIEDAGGYDHVQFFKAELKSFEFGVAYYLV